jgi:hypothetical protein
MARPASLYSDPSLTQGHSDILEYQIRSSRPGMAHFANTGPLGRTCAECQHFGYYQQRRDAAGNPTGATFRRNGCEKFHELTGKHGPAVPPSAAACKYFQPKDDEPQSA